MLNKATTKHQFSQGDDNYFPSLIPTITWMSPHGKENIHSVLRNEYI
jgi:hypothetical protein